MNSAIEVSIVVPTYRRASKIPRLIESLESQIEAPPFEIIVIDDGSDDETKQLLAALPLQRTRLIRFVSLDLNRGPAAARNVGWRMANGRWVAFTDDDCRPSESWLCCLMHGAESADIVQGKILPEPLGFSSRGPFSRTLSVTSQDGFYQTANIAYRRALLEELDGFDESFRMAVGEDTDLAWRAIKAGAVTKFQPSAVVYHEVSTSNILSLIRDTKRWDGVVQVVHLHPELRSRFNKGLFWRPEQGRSVLAFLSLLYFGLCISSVGGWFGLSILGILPYFRYRLFIRPMGASRWDRVSGSFGWLLIDVCATLVYLRSRMRYG